MKPQQTDWVVFLRETNENDETKVRFVLCTNVTEDKLKEILGYENRKRCYYGNPPLRYVEFDPAPNDPLIYEVERQFLQGEGIGRNAEFENLVCDLLKEQGRTTSGVTSTARDDESDEVWIKPSDWANKFCDKRDKETVLKRLSKSREKSQKTGRKFKEYDILLE